MSSISEMFQIIRHYLWEKIRQISVLAVNIVDFDNFGINGKKMILLFRVKKSQHPRSNFMKTRAKI